MAKKNDSCERGHQFFGPQIRASSAPLLPVRYDGRGKGHCVVRPRRREGASEGGEDCLSFPRKTWSFTSDSDLCPWRRPARPTADSDLCPWRRPARPYRRIPSSSSVTYLPTTAAYSYLSSSSSATASSSTSSHSPSFARASRMHSASRMTSTASSSSSSWPSSASSSSTFATSASSTSPAPRCRRKNRNVISSPSRRRGSRTPRIPLPDYFHVLYCSPPPIYQSAHPPRLISPSPDDLDPSARNGSARCIALFGTGPAAAALVLSLSSSAAAATYSSSESLSSKSSQSSSAESSRRGPRRRTESHSAFMGVAAAC
eukprot:CAMPEP_0113571426 /NCGR_PEP_ID=MMETSP0015_2-20120614/25544_1 /TAXON_ID=2838 /ORGANISM="Odontella" /LENGTH=315 /DNA_ID=CAMNT_0000474369 /DNA_START=282 /DNA_END=1228 /DNA_ORIENTATION=+ /assembly_acc=CAM_ASM_000160